MKLCSYCTWVLSWNLPELSNHRPDKEDCSFEDKNDIILFENASTHYTNVDVWLVYLKPDPMPVNQGMRLLEHTQHFVHQNR